MTKQEQKEYIIKTWNTSSGKRISEMLKRYWFPKDDEEIINAAKKIFGVSDTINGA